MQSQNQNILFTILHFNDVYDIQPNKKGQFGIVNFEARLRQLKKQYPRHLVLFSGDCFSPSILTNIFEGKQMVKSLNKLNIDVACYGNHQFDLDSEVTLELAESCNFPWLLGNLTYKDTSFILGNGKPSLIKQFYGIKIGFFGVAGEDWLGILSQQYEGQISYEDVNKYSKKMCHYLRQQQKCDMIIALTHMRVYQDKKLSQEVSDIDIDLGGHDHIIMRQFINNIPTLKSGDNFKSIGVIHVYEKNKNENAQCKGRNFDFDVQIQQIPIAVSNIDEELKNYVDSCIQQYNKSDHIVGYTDVPLDTRFAQIRTKETNYGNFITDLIRTYYDVNVCIINSGSIRMDALIPPGQLRYSQISNIINNVVVVKQVSGLTLLQVLQYSVSGLPGFSGCFLLISGIRFTYNIKLTPRVQEVYIDQQPLRLDKNYTLATHLYIATGGDGFDMLKPQKIIVDPIAGIDTLRLLLKFFKGSSKFEEYNNKNQSKKSQQKQNDDDELLLQVQMLNAIRRKSTRTDRLINFKKTFIVDNNGKKYACISPCVDGRSKQIIN